MYTRDKRLEQDRKLDFLSINIFTDILTLGLNIFYPN